MEKGIAPWWLRIKFRVLVFGIFMSILPLLLIGYATINSVSLNLKEKIQKHNLERATIIADQVETSIRDIAEDLHHLASASDTNLIGSNTLDRERILNILLQQEPYLEEIKVANQNFDVLGQVSRRDVLLAKSPEIKLDNIMIDKSKPYSVSFVSFSKDRRPEFYVTVSILNPQTREQIGYLQAKADLKGLISNFINTRIGNAGYVYFIDNSGNLIGHTDFSRVLRQEDFTVNPAVQSFLTYQPKPYEYKNSDNIDVIGLFARVETPNWAVFIEQPVIEAYEPIYSFARKLLIILILTMTGVTLLSIVFGLKLVQPIEKLEAQVSKIRATGDLLSDIPQITKDEIGRLAYSFKQLMTMLDEKNQNVKAEKELLRTVVDGIGAGMILLNSQRKIIWWNPTFAEWFGDRNYLNISCEEVYKGKENLDCVFSKNGRLVSFDLNGEKRHLRHMYYHIPLENSEHAEYLVLLEDVTQSIEMEARVIETDKMAAIGLLASGIAHEINNPLAIISAHSEDLLDCLKREPDKVKVVEIEEVLEITSQQVVRCKYITDGLLHFARKSNSEYTLLDVSLISSKTIDLIGYRARQKNIKINKHLESKLFVLGNENELQQVILNLLSNAIDATEDYKNVEVKAWGVKEEIFIEIKDNGGGISPSIVKKVLNPFFTTKPPGQGTGLGLFVCYGIIKRMNGRLSLDSVEGKGTTVKIDLPAYKVG